MHLVLFRHEFGSGQDGVGSWDIAVVQRHLHIIGSEVAEINDLLKAVNKSENFSLHQKVLRRLLVLVHAVGVKFLENLSTLSKK